MMGALSLILEKKTTFSVGLIWERSHNYSRFNNHVKWAHSQPAILYVKNYKRTAKAAKIAKFSIFHQSDLFPCEKAILPVFQLKMPQYL